MNRLKHYIAAAMLLFAVGGMPALRAETSSDPHSDSLKIQQAFDIVMPKLMDRHRVPGLAVGIVMEGEVALVKGYGYADKNRRLPVTRDTVFQAASISKPVSAWVAMKLVEEGKLELDAPISRYLTRWQLPQSKFDNDEVTLRRILSHTAGLSIPGYRGFVPGRRLQTIEESLTAAADADNQPLAVVFPPGQGWHYSGGGYTLMQLVVEEIAKQSFAEFAQSAVLIPLGMNNSYFEAPQQPRSEIAVAYGRAGVPLPDYRFTAEAAAGLRTTPADLARFVAALMPGPSDLSQGRGVIRPEIIEQMLSPQPHSANNLLFHGSTWGLGYGLKRLPSTKELLVYHPGDNIPGWHGMIAALPAKGSGFVMLTNGEDGRKLRMDAFCLWFKLQGADILRECDGHP
jgi:CubicO group peptidase (beta-lactamase class C family)